MELVVTTPSTVKRAFKRVVIPYQPFIMFKFVIQIDKGAYIGFSR